MRLWFVGGCSLVMVACLHGQRPDPTQSGTLEGTDTSSTAATGDTAQPTLPDPVCGDGVVQGPEACDEGEANGTQGASCASDCTRPALPFGPPTDTEANGTTPSDMKAADINQDGVLDLIVSYAASNDVEIVYGMGDGRWWPHRSYPPYGETIVRVADVNADGIDDVIVPDLGSAAVVLFEGTLDGVQTTGTPSSTQPPGESAGPPVDLALADVNDDGWLDIITANTLTNNLTLLVGDGTGNFTATDTFALPGEPTRLAIGDITGGSQLEAAVTLTQSDQLFLLSLNAAGFAGPVDSFPLDDPYALVMADFNRDGKQDVAVTQFTEPSAVTIYYTSTPDAFFDQFLNVTTEDPGTSRGVLPTSIAAGDVSGDGIPDLVVGSAESADVVVLETGKSKTNPSMAVHYLPTPEEVLGTVVADLDNDGHQDILTSSFGYISWQRGLGGFLFAPALTTYSDRFRGELAVGDVNGDVSLDVVAAGIEVLPQANGTLLPAVAPSSQSGPVTAVAVGRLDEDARVDWAAAFEGPLEAGFATELQNFHSGFRSGWPATGTTTKAKAYAAMALADLDGDLAMDAVLASDAGTVEVWVNTGNGRNFTPAKSLMGGGVVSDVAVMDVDGNQDPDIAASLPDVDEIRVWRGGPNATFTGPTSLATAAGSRPISVVFADANDDGHIDVVTANAGTDNAAVFAGDGTGSFGPPTYVAAAISPRAGTDDVGVGDINGDGVTDLVFTHATNDEITVALAFEPGVFAAPQRLDTASGPLVVQDLDDDGVYDVAIRTGNTLRTWWSSTAR